MKEIMINIVIGNVCFTLCLGLNYIVTSVGIILLSQVWSKFIFTFTWMEIINETLPNVLLCKENLFSSI